MFISKINVTSVGDYSYKGRRVRALNLDNGKVLFLAKDVATKVLGVVNSFNLTKSVDSRCKAELVLTFDEDLNPQRYIFVDIDGLTCIVYRARKSEVDRLDFIKWAQEKGEN